MPFEIFRENQVHLFPNVKQLPYPLDSNPGVVFFKMDFWVGFSSKNPLKSGLLSQKVGVYSRKTPKTGQSTLPGTLFKSGAAIKWIRCITLGQGRNSRVLILMCNFGAGQKNPSIP